MQFYSSPWAASYDDEIRHFNIMRKMKSWPRDSDANPIDGVQVILRQQDFACGSRDTSN